MGETEMGVSDYTTSNTTFDIKEINQKLYACYRTYSTNDEDVEWNKAIYRALRIVNGEK